MEDVRPAAVAGMFYPGNRGELDRTVRHLMADAGPAEGPVPKAVIAPHAGYPYSGPLAARAYARLAAGAGTIRRVVLVGPSHRVPFQGLAVTGARAYATPLGEVPLDSTGRDALLALSGVEELDAAHAREHSLEVHLPFLQEVLDDFTLLPMVAGTAGPELVARALETVWGGPETVFVISTDLTHFLDYDTARHWDERTAHAIEALDEDAIGEEQACGRVPVRGLLRAARAHGLHPGRLGLCSSGDAAGPRDRVVGYGAWTFTEAEAGHA